MLIEKKCFRASERWFEGYEFNPCLGPIIPVSSLDSRSYSGWCVILSLILIVSQCGSVSIVIVSNTSTKVKAWTQEVFQCFSLLSPPPPCSTWRACLKWFAEVSRWHSVIWTKQLSANSKKRWVSNSHCCHQYCAGWLLEAFWSFTLGAVYFYQPLRGMGNFAFQLVYLTSASCESCPKCFD